MNQHDIRIAGLLFSSVFPLYLKKIESKGRNKEELMSVIQWLTGFDSKTIEEKIEQKVNFTSFFDDAQVPVEAHLIKGLICGYRVEEIENPLTQKVRYLDKLVDEMAKGKSLDKIIRRK